MLLLKNKNLKRRMGVHVIGTILHFRAAADPSRGTVKNGGANGRSRTSQSDIVALRFQHGCFKVEF
jgi:hypothetical protein